MRVGEYDILRRIGSGAYGKVYLARKGDPDGFRTYYALKRLRLEHAGDEAFERYLLREARHGGLVNHRNLMRIHDVLRLDAEYVLVMDYVDGITLRDVLAPRRESREPLPADVALEIAADVLGALGYIHTLVDPEGRESGFVHRDVKPGNIMLTTSGGLRLMDFGVARAEDAEVATQTGELRGTIAYMAPEQAAGKQATPAADQFAAGLVLLEMLTATPAWGDPRGLGILGKVVQGDVSEGLVRLEATDPVAVVLMRMLQPDPADRFPTATEAADALRDLRADSATPPGLPAFAQAEIERVRGTGATTAAIPSWTDSEDDDAELASGTWTRAGAPPLAIDDSGGSTEPDPHQTLPVGPGQVHARDLLDEESRAVEESPAPPGETEPPGAMAWTEKTLPFTGGATAPQGMPQPPQPQPPVQRPPGAAIPGGPLPPAYSSIGADGLPRVGPKRVDVAGSPLLGAGLGVVLLLLVGGVVWAAFRPVQPSIQEIDPLAGSPPTAVSEPATAAPVDAELPGAAAISEVLIEDDVPADEAALDEAELAEVAAGNDPVARTEPVSARPLAEPTAAPAADSGDGAVVSETRWEESAAAESSDDGLQPGEIIGGARTRPKRTMDRRTVDQRRTQDDQLQAADSAPLERGADTEDRSEPSAPEPVDEGPTLRFVSAAQQPLGVPLSLRVRSNGFRATDVAVYYQWRGEGQAGRRKRSLTRQSDGSFTLEIPASELKQDRLQVWFLAEPGAVAAGSASRPIEVKVR